VNRCSAIGDSIMLPQPDGFSIATLLPDGKASPPVPVPDSGLRVGRTVGDITFPQDARMAPSQACFTPKSGHVLMEDLSGLGMYVRLLAPYALKDGDILLMGAQRFQFRQHTELLATETATSHRTLESTLDTPLAELLSTKSSNSQQVSYAVHGDDISLGRKAGTYTFDDPLMSARHARVYQRGEVYFVEDLGSRNGTFALMRDQVSLLPGASVIIGSQILIISGSCPRPASRKSHARTIPR